MAKIRQLNRDIMNREEAKEVMKVYTATMSSLRRLRAPEGRGVGRGRRAQQPKSKLKLPLRTRTKEGESEIDAQLPSRYGFGPSATMAPAAPGQRLSPVLGLEVPATALEIYKKAETFRRQTGNLELDRLQAQPDDDRDAAEWRRLSQGAAHEDRPDAGRGIKELLMEEPRDRLVHRRRLCRRQRARIEMLFALKGNLREVVAEMERLVQGAVLVRSRSP